MAHGGRREGAGRRKSAATLARLEADAAAAANGGHPLEHMLAIMRDETEPRERRDAMAIAAAPYVHARRRRITVDGDASVTIVHEDAISELE